jgi:hypothetical protein
MPIGIVDGEGRTNVDLSTGALVIRGTGIESVARVSAVAFVGDATDGKFDVQPSQILLPAHRELPAGPMTRNAGRTQRIVPVDRGFLPRCYDLDHYCAGCVQSTYVVVWARQDEFHFRW